MNCTQAQALLHPHHDGELDAANTLQMEQHLADCPLCVGALRKLEATRAVLRQEGLRYQAPPALRQAVLKAAREAARPKPAVAALRNRWQLTAVAFCFSGGRRTGNPVLVLLTIAIQLKKMLFSRSANPRATSAR